MFCGTFVYVEVRAAEITAEEKNITAALFFYHGEPDYEPLMGRSGKWSTVI